MSADAERVHAERCRVASCDHPPFGSTCPAWCDGCRALAATFDPVWRECEARGECDAHGSAEYERIVGEWFTAGRPRLGNLAAWVRSRANWFPGSEN